MYCGELWEMYCGELWEMNRQLHLVRIGFYVLWRAVGNVLWRAVGNEQIITFSYNRFLCIVESCGK